MILQLKEKDIEHLNDNELTTWLTFYEARLKGNPLDGVGNQMFKKLSHEMENRNA